jgi:DNA-binding NarL/FixJ family response regulator
VVAIDDAHHLDPLSASLVVQCLEHHDLRVVLAARPELGAATADLLRTGLLTRSDVGPLDQEDVEAVATLRFGTSLEPASAERLLAYTAGNPLFLRELLEAADAAGVLVPVEHQLVFEPGAMANTRLEDLLLAHRNVLDEDGRAVMDVLACTGGSLGRSLLDRLASPESVDRLAVSGLVEIDRVGSSRLVRLRHPLIEECINALLAETHRSAIFGRLIDLAVGSEEVDPITIGLWQLRSGRPDGSGLLVAGAQAALARFDAGLALQLAEAAVEVDGAFEARLLAARSRALLGRDGPDTLRTLFEDAMAGGDDHRIRATASALARHLRFVEGDVDESFLVFDRALDVLVDRHDREAVLTEWGAVTIYSRDVRLAIPQLAPILEDPSAHPATRAAAAVPLAVAYSFSGQTAAVIRCNQIWAELVRALPVVESQIPRMPASARAIAHMHSGDLAAMHRVIDEQQAELRAIGEVEHAGFFEINRAAALIYAGWVQDGLDRADGLLAIGRRWDPMRLLPFALSLMGYASALTGRLDDARALVAEMASLPEDYRRPAEAFRHQALGWIAVAEGDRRAAVAHLRTGAATAASMGLTFYQAELLHHLTRLGVSSEAVHQELKAVVADFDSDVIAHNHAATARALADGDASTLESLAADYAARNSILNAADGWGLAAQLHERRGDAVAAMACRDHAQAELGRTGVASTPATTAPIPNLTAREEEVARLAAAGLSNREIAERLGTAKRTVDNQLTAVYRKLSVSGRSELERALGPAT